jgi:uncharacterized protein (DUF433 family)
MMPTNQYIELRNGAYYVAGTRIGLDVITHEFRNGRSAEAIFEAYPALESLAKLYGTITFILEHPAEIDAYLKDQDRRYEEIKLQHPLPQDLIERFERGKAELSSKQG